ncbi:hypothetical protein Tco_1003849 [Tanacetum coccineum]|uniref:Uncharacterized protein n=1 Tax=Tanacetum coccineum TaxID=301880 RepID=A0ABQ5FA80_9ASTR
MSVTSKESIQVMVALQKEAAAASIVADDFTRRFQSGEAVVNVNFPCVILRSRDLKKITMDDTSCDLKKITVDSQKICNGSAHELENVIVVGADNRPSMLDKTQYSSWESRILLYIKGNEHGKLLVDSVLNGPFQFGTVVLRKSMDIKETNIVLQGLSQDIYNLVNHNEHAKQIWDRVKLLIQGSELSLQERESKLYDDFETFTSMPGESIHTITCGLVVPYFLPFDDPIASLNKEMAFISIAFASRYPPTNNQLRTLSNLRNQATIQDGRVTVQTIQGRQTQGYANSGEEGHMARQCTKPKRPKNSAWFKEKMLLTEALESRATLDAEQLAFLADNGDTFTPAQAS